MYFDDPKDQAEFDARNSSIGVLIGYPNEHTKTKLIREEIRQALLDRKILFLRRIKKSVDSSLELH